MKYFLYILKNDLSNIFKYPKINTPEDFTIDYNIYWNTRKRNLVDKGEKLSSWQLARARLTAQYIEKGSTVLDIGSGGGAVLEYLRNTLDINPIGIDISSDSLHSLRTKNIKAIDIDISKPEQIEQIPDVDYIIGFEILEHIPNPENLIFLLKNKAKKGMMFSFPNTGYYAHRLRFLFGRFPLQWVVHPGEHLRFWTLSDVRSWIPQLKIKLKYLTVYKGLPVLSKIFPSVFGAGIFFVLDTSL